MGKGKGVELPVGEKDRGMSYKLRERTWGGATSREKGQKEELQVKRKDRGRSTR
jgi:hypothetical protein